MSGPSAEPETLQPEHILRNLLAVIHRDGGHYTDEHGLLKAGEDAEKIVIGLRAAPQPSDERAAQWISVEERRPDKQVMVLVANPDWPAGFPRVMMGHLDGLGEWCGHYSDQEACGWGITSPGLPTHDPTYWMPLPEAPRAARASQERKP